VKKSCTRGVKTSFFDRYSGGGGKCWGLERRSYELRVRGNRTMGGKVRALTSTDPLKKIASYSPRDPLSGHLGDQNLLSNCLGRGHTILNMGLTLHAGAKQESSKMTQNVVVALV